MTSHRDEIPARTVPPHGDEIPARTVLPHGDGIPTRIVLRPLGSPLTVAMGGLAIASLVQSGLDLRWIGLDQTRETGLILVSVPFVLQLIASVLAYLARDATTGAALGVLALSWLALGLIHVTSSPGTRSGALGLMLLASGAVLIISASAVALAKPLPAVVVALAGLRFVLAGIYELGGTSFWQRCGAIIGLAVVALAGYCVLAFELEGQQHRPILPTFRRGRGRITPDADPRSQTAEITAEPGVHQTI